MLYKSHFAIIDELILLYKLIHDIFTQDNDKHDIFVQDNDKHDIFETFNDKQLRLKIVL